MLQKIKIYIIGGGYITIRCINTLNFITNNVNKLNFFKNFINQKQKNILKHYFIYSYIIYFLRIIWRGKAYRIRLFKKSNKFTMNFGHSHWCKILYKNGIFKFSRIRRQNYLVLFNNRYEGKLLFQLFNSIREYNKYTRRGIRIKKRVFLKRFGKISQVNSILHSF